MFAKIMQENEDRRRFGNKNKQTYFVLLSTSATFAKNKDNYRR
jgi:hypothetical protein